MTGPVISVITVARNLVEAGRQDTILEALDCVQRQSFHDIEHVVWDGMSDDGTADLLTAAIAERRGGVPIRFVRGADAGLYDAMNRAVAQCSGDYVIFLNSDDSLATDQALQQLADCARRQNADFVFGTSVEERPDGSSKEFRRTNLKAFLQRMPCCHNSMMLRRSMFDDLGGHDLSLRVASDYDFVFRMLVAGHRGEALDAPVSIYSDRGASADLMAVARDYATVWSRYFSALTGAEIDVDTCVGWYRTGTLPIAMCRAALRASDGNPLLRQAARHSLKITIRRGLRPWRSWDNLKGL